MGSKALHRSHRGAILGALSQVNEFFFFVSGFVKILLIHIISKLVVLLTARAIVVSRNAII